MNGFVVTIRIAPALWSAVTRHRFPEATCRRQMWWCAGITRNRRYGRFAAPLCAALFGRQVGQTEKLRQVAVLQSLPAQFEGFV
jgi:hypothetical protein